jgi:NADH:ubiquinone oxidoreductase subunit E
MEPLEILWNALLSRQPDIIREVYFGLDEDSRSSVLAHLKAMANEEGWHPEQVLSARAALAALEKKKAE